MTRHYTLELGLSEAARKARRYNRSYFVATTTDCLTRYVAVPYRRYIRSPRVMPALYIVRPTGELIDYRATPSTTEADRG
jgi:hypothetical protein